MDTHHAAAEAPELSRLCAHELVALGDVVDELEALLGRRVICRPILEVGRGELPRRRGEDLVGRDDHHDLAEPLHGVAERMAGQFGLHQHRRGVLLLDFAVVRNNLVDIARAMVPSTMP